MPASPYYDPEIRAVFEAGSVLGPSTWKTQTGFGPPGPKPDFPGPRLGTVDGRTLAAVRENRLLLNDSVELSDAVTRTDVMVPGAPGDPDVRLRVHRPANADVDAVLPALFWMHGGGYVLGSPEQDDYRFDRWCERFDMVGVCVQYRLAPEHPYPAAVNDAYAGLSWLKQHGAEVGVDSDRVGIGGPSGGGGLAAALGLVVRDRGEFAVDYQMLIYPMIDDTQTTVSSQWDVPVWDPASNRFGWTSYLGDLYGTDDVPAHAAPSRATDLSGLPSTFIMAGTLDGFVDEDIDYATRLNHAGVAVELHLYPGAPHGFDGFAPSTAASRQARADINDWLSRQLARG